MVTGFFESAVAKDRVRTAWQQGDPSTREAAGTRTMISTEGSCKHTPRAERWDVQQGLILVSLWRLNVGTTFDIPVKCGDLQEESSAGDIDTGCLGTHTHSSQTHSPAHHFRVTLIRAPTRLGPNPVVHSWRNLRATAVS